MRQAECRHDRRGLRSPLRGRAAPLVGYHSDLRCPEAGAADARELRRAGRPLPASPEPGHPQLLRSSGAANADGGSAVGVPSAAGGLLPWQEPDLLPLRQDRVLGRASGPRHVLAARGRDDQAAAQVARPEEMAPRVLHHQVPAPIPSAPPGLPDPHRVRRQDSVGLARLRGVFQVQEQPAPAPTVASGLPQSSDPALLRPGFPAHPGSPAHARRGGGGVPPRCRGGEAEGGGRPQSGAAEGLPRPHSAAGGAQEHGSRGRRIQSGDGLRLPPALAEGRPLPCDGEVDGGDQHGAAGRRRSVLKGQGRRR
mmetsp:Transcript_1339/g.5725  ORF Transcript_1339/g.5725 Transcript_1339/m.5725 type:complete len:310 (-) Transcript_1339:1567-2496(-)